MENNVDCIIERSTWRLEKGLQFFNNIFHSSLAMILDVMV